MHSIGAHFTGMFRFLVILLLTFMPGVSLAQATDSAIGRLNYAGFKKRIHCTASLMSANTALTARHCVETFPVDGLRVVLGYSKGEWVELHTIKKVNKHPTQDIALLCFNKASRQQPIDVATAAPQRLSKSVTTIGYPRSRKHAQGVKTCKLQPGKTRARLLCGVEPGMSGAPVMRTIAGNRKVIGIVSGSNGASSIVELITSIPKTGC